MPSDVPGLPEVLKIQVQQVEPPVEAGAGICLSAAVLNQRPVNSWAGHRRKDGRTYWMVPEPRLLNVSACDLFVSSSGK